MIDSTRTIFKQTTIYGIGNTIRKLSGVIILPLIKTYTSEAEFGAYTLLETIFIFTMVISEWGVKSGFNRWYHEMPSDTEKKSLFFTVSLFNYIVTIFFALGVGALLYYFSVPLLRFNLTPTVVWLFTVGGILRLFQDVPFSLLKLLNKAKEQTLYASFNVLLTIIFMIWFMSFRKLGFEGIYHALFWAHLITFFTLIPIYRKHLKFSFKRKELKEMISYGLPLMVSAILTTTLNLSDRHIINHFKNIAESGNYGLAVKVANLLDMIFVASFITSFTFYYMQKMHDPDSINVFNRLQRYFIIILAVAGFGIVLFSGEITWVVSSGDDYYQEGVKLIPFLILGLMFSGLRYLFTLPLSKHKKTMVISRILVIAGLINFGLNIWWVPKYGKIGAAWSTLLVQMFAMVWLFIESRKYEEIKFRVKNTIVLFIIWIVFVSASYYVNTTPWHNLHWKILLGISFLVSLVVFRVIKMNEITEMKRTLLGVLKK